MPYNFTTIEKKWQRHWLENRSFAALDPKEAGKMPKAYVLDMFPYPSGSGLHVGHPEGYTATDIYSRFLRMKGYNVLHPMGWDAFGLPAEQYAVKTNTHPAVTTQANINRFREQIQSLGLSYDWDREVDTTDEKYYRWTQWIFLQIFNSYFDPVENKAKPIGFLMEQLLNENYVVGPDGSIHINPVSEGMESIGGTGVTVYRLWKEISADEQREVIDNQRLAYTDEVPVNWCSALGTVLANEEVIDGKSEVGGFPVERRPMRQWMLRITAYAQRLIDDLDLLNWPDSLKDMQRNWIGRSEGAEVDFELEKPLPPDEEGQVENIRVFTTRPDTLYGATYMVLAPEHELVERITTPDQKKAVEEYRAKVGGKSERDRMADTKVKTGVFTGAYAINPVDDRKIPIWIADYVLMGYGTGAIMAVPAHDQRDWDFAKQFNLPIIPVVKPLKGELPKDHAYEELGIAMNSEVINGLPTDEAKKRITSFLHAQGIAKAVVRFKLRDWLFSRQRYWGEPFPIVIDEQGFAHAVPEKELPVKLPAMEDFKPTGTPEPPLSKAKDWLKYSKDGKTFVRETNTMPQWAGSCWYYLRYMDPKNPNAFLDPEMEKYWMPVDLYVGGAEHAVLHLLYSRFWHKVLFDLDHVTSAEPFAKLVNQGIILGEAEHHYFTKPDGSKISMAELRDIGEEATDKGLAMTGYEKSTGARCVGTRVTEDDVERKGDAFVLKSDPNIRVDSRSFKMSKSRGNVVNPDNIVQDYGADAFRLYEMYMGPLEASKPWNTRDIVGMSRFLNSIWRNLVGDDENAVGCPKVKEVAASAELLRTLHKAFKKVEEDISGLRFNTGIAELIKLNNELTGLQEIPRVVAIGLTLMLAPFAPHMAEELWNRLGNPKSLAREAWPAYNPQYLVETSIELPVQVNGKIRDKLVVAVDADEKTVLDLAMKSEKVKPWIEGKTIKTAKYVPKKLITIAVG